MSNWVHVTITGVGCITESVTVRHVKNASLDINYRDTVRSVSGKKESGILGPACVLELRG